MMMDSGFYILGGLWLMWRLSELAWLDIRYGLLYDRLVAVVAISAVYPWGIGNHTLLDAVLGGMTGGCFLWSLRWLSGGGIGMGDVKLAAAMGLWLGWQAMIPSMALAFLTGGMTALVLLLRRDRGLRDRLPFGPFLAAGGVMGYWFGAACWQWYEAML